jgi:hypothetical protein
MFTKLFWQRTTERAVKTFAQALAGVLTAAGLGLFEVPWPKALSTAGMVALLSVLTSLASTKLGDEEDPSVLPAADEEKAPVTAVAVQLPGRAQPSATEARGIA